MPSLGVNIDHVATIRQARRTNEPDPVWAAAMAELGGCDQITVHLREDRRHIQDRDLRLLKETVKVRLNLECACVAEMISIACQLKPTQVCLVPERREEVTTEGGLNVAGNLDLVTDCVKQLQQAGIKVSLFVDPDRLQLDAAEVTGAEIVELHTGAYAHAWMTSAQATRWQQIVDGVAYARQLGLTVDAGHGLTYTNVEPIAKISELHELNIGHSIISRAIFSGLTEAVREMKAILNRCSVAS